MSETAPETPEAIKKKKPFNPSLIIIAILGLAFIIFIVIAPQGKYAGPPPVGSLTPDFTLKDIAGKSWTLSELRGRVVLINFWATWCPPCREEMPSLSRLSNDLAQKDNFVLLTVLYQDSVGNAKTYFADMGYKMPVLIDPGGKVAKMYALTGVPETYVIGKSGILQKHFIGPVDFDSADARDYLISLIQKKN